MEAVIRACENDSEWMRMIQKSWDCGDCGNELKERMMMDCIECGQGIGEEELHQILIGRDVVGLFPAMKSKNTGRIIRRRILKSKIKTQGFNWRQGARYIVINKHLTDDLSSIWKVLPWKRSGAKISMKNKDLISKKEKLEDTWCFPMCLPTEEQEKEILARVAEIGLRTIFENFCYWLEENG